MRPCTTPYEGKMQVENRRNNKQPKRDSTIEIRKSHQKLKDSTTFVNISIIYDYACTKIHCNGITPWSKYCAFGLEGQWPITFICLNFRSGDIIICIYSRTFCPIVSSTSSFEEPSSTFLVKLNIVSKYKFL